MSKYFNEKIYNPQYEKKQIEELLQEHMTLVVGDFWGIQSFIFERLSTKNAAKVLRSKSAFVQIFTQVLAEYICQKLAIDKKYILTTNAGKFEILVPMQNIDLSDVQKKVDEYFIKNFYGLSGAVICSIEVSKNEWQSNYKKFRDKVAKTVEMAKFKKFDLINQNPVLEYDEAIDNQTLCKICNIRKIEQENCHICDIFVELGKILTKNNIQEIGSDDLGIVFDEFTTIITIDKKIKSYIPKNEYENPMTFEKIAKNSCDGKEQGIKALGVIKADVDGMGDFIKNSDITKSFENFDEFSKGLDSFFSIHVPSLLRDKYRNIYTVFAGGDDLFLIGAWDEVMEFARRIQKEFKAYVQNKRSISFGIAVAKPSTPVSYLATYTEELLEASKECDGKDALTIWDETIKWDDYLKVYETLQNAFEEYRDLETSTVYRLLNFCEMSKKARQGDIKETIWKSKLNYLFSRNLDIKKDTVLMETLGKHIDKHPSETKVFLNEFVYKRRVA